MGTTRQRTIQANSILRSSNVVFEDDPTLKQHWINVYCWDTLYYNIYSCTGVPNAYGNIIFSHILYIIIYYILLLLFIIIFYIIIII